MNIPNSPETTLSPAHIQQLKQQPFSAGEPGIILKDFGALLDFIAVNPVPLSGKNRLFTLKILPELNRLLTSPLDVKLQRPLQKSFPQLNGLYLLLRISGLTRVTLEGKQAVMRLNDIQIAAWEALNPAERYFALLQAWCRPGSTELIGERSDWLGNDFYLQVVDFFIRSLHGGDHIIDTDGKVRDSYGLRFHPGLHNLALMELFGFITITLGPRFKDETWPVAKVRPTAWGQALLALFENKRMFIDRLDTTELENILSGHWIQKLKPYIPAWQNDLPELGGEVVTEGSYLLKVSLGSVYRRIAAPATATLDEVAYCILDAFNFDYEHLYEFIYPNRYGIPETIAHPMCDTLHPLCTEDCTLGHLPLDLGSEVVFHYDFGDDWEFQITVEALEEKSRIKAPKIVERQGKAPKQYRSW